MGVHRVLHYSETLSIKYYEQKSYKKTIYRKITKTAVSQADLPTPDMNGVKWLRQQLRTVMLWEFFLLYL